MTLTYQQIQVQQAVLGVRYRISQIGWEFNPGAISLPNRNVWTSCSLEASNRVEDCPKFVGLGEDEICSNSRRAVLVLTPAFSSITLYVSPSCDELCLYHDRSHLYCY